MFCIYKKNSVVTLWCGILVTDHKTMTFSFRIFNGSRLDVNIQKPKFTAFANTDQSKEQWKETVVGTKYDQEFFMMKEYQNQSYTLTWEQIIPRLPLGIHSVSRFPCTAMIHSGNLPFHLGPSPSTGQCTHLYAGRSLGPNFDLQSLTFPKSGEQKTFKHHEPGE